MRACYLHTRGGVPLSSAGQTRELSSKAARLAVQDEEAEAEAAMSPQPPASMFGRLMRRMGGGGGETAAAADEPAASASAPLNPECVRCPHALALLLNHPTRAVWERSLFATMRRKKCRI